nr:proteasome subunit alpha type-3 [Paratrimastix eleionoma]
MSALGGSGYDLSVSTYSQDGKIFQVEYAQKAVESGGTVIGVRGANCVVLAMDKPLISEMQVKGTPRISTVSVQAGMVGAGLAPDARAIANWSRNEAQQYKGFYHHEIPIKVLTERTSLFMHYSTISDAFRPFGTSMVLGGFDHDHAKPQLFMIEPSGKCYGYRGVAVGGNQTAVRNELEKLDFATLQPEQAVLEVARILYAVHDQTKQPRFEIELSWAAPQTNYKHVPVPHDLFVRAEDAAKQFLEDQDLS